jgi:hypothetical protein
MDTVELKGFGVFRGTHYGSVGVYTHADRSTYAGERHKGGKASGHGVHTNSNGTTSSGHFADGDRHGYREEHGANGAVGYGLYERNDKVHRAMVFPDGDCAYDNKPCGVDHADFAALKAFAQRAGVRTCPLPASNAMCVRLCVCVRVCAYVYVRACVCVLLCEIVCVRVRVRVYF